MFQRGTIMLLGKLDIGFAGRIQSLGIPAQGLGFFYRALRIVTERAWPVNGELRSQLMPDAYRVCQAPLGVLTDLRRFGCRTGRPHRVEERLGGDHGTFQAVLL